MEGILKVFKCFRTLLKALLKFFSAKLFFVSQQCFNFKNLLKGKLGEEVK